MVVGVLQLDLRFHDCQSLKAKRSRLRFVLAKLRNTFEAAVAEVGDQDLWQRTRIGVVTVGNDRAVINQRLDHVVNFIEDLGEGELIDHRIELINM